MRKAQDDFKGLDDGICSSLSQEDLAKPLLIGNDIADRHDHGQGRWITRATQWAYPKGNAMMLWLTFLNLVLLTISIILLNLAFSRQAYVQYLSDQEKWKSTSHYAPLLDRVDIPRVTLTPNASLYDTDPPSILRIPSGPEADAEWFRIGTGVMPIIISSDEIYKLGKDPSVAVKIPEEHGYGNDAYIAQTEVFHLLHCLDMLRKEISYEHYYFPRFGNHPDAEHIAHISHCIDILAQAIKCSSSVDVILFNWVEGWEQPFPDFNNQHVCRDFETLLRYVNENSVSRSVWKTMKEPPAGYVRLPEPAPAGPAESDRNI
ncbi:hypothetical protein F9C07_2281309 [Aspergillus flavus]|uniref:Tat pathway signal sequence n=2 Tax=Aspergillus flavus TaxID=5059 RepID=A0A7U2QW91_ASPFN|nr:hypothetical protein BDV35DRAFT_388380 [Aspergillus flavus]KAF7617432.1 hypothetical protein AFLA_006356 [Aspergillus flavus NRRL3357]KOC14830.1 hypothetical protein AFLA70_201g001910 [Aspergillus flavus AF70]QRD85120.1 hypothetical protein F9C07_2281309 [Aspergillus flavus]